MSTFAIGIPTLNRYDLLKEALERYYVIFPNTKIFIIDNGNQNIDDSHPNVSVYQRKKEKGDMNLGVAGSWNKLCEFIYKEHTHALILNDDIIFGKSENKVSDFIDKNVYDFYVGIYYWSVFVLPRTTFEKVGRFDRLFYPAYYEDNDIAYRLKLSHCSYCSTDFFDPIVKRNSMTLEKDVSVKDNFERNKALYKKKWGGEPGEEKYITPFNKNY